MHSYGPERFFDERGRLVPELRATVPAGERRMGQNPHANGGKLLVPLELPDYGNYAVPVPAPGTTKRESTRQLGMLLRDVYKMNQAAKNFRYFCPDETNSNRLGSVFDVENRCFVGAVRPDDDHLSPEGRVMEVL